MDEIETDEIGIVQKIGNEICDGCGPHRDCGLRWDECCRISNALDILSKYAEEIKAAEFE